MSDELDQRIRSLEAERLRPVPPPVPTRKEPLSKRIARLQVLADVLETDDEDAEED